MLALRQIQLFARHHYADVLLSTAFLGFIIVCATFFKPEVTLLLTFAAVYITLLMTTRLHFPITPIFPIVNFTPIYLHLNAIKACENQIAVLYFEITSKINPQHKKELLENISFAIGQDKLSRLNNNSFLCSITLQSTLEKIKKILPGQIEYFYSSHWQADGLTALNKVYVLKKRLLNFNENLIITPQTIEQDFITEFPSAKIVSLEKSKDIAIYFKTIRKNKEACRQIVSAVNKAWIGLPSPVIVNKYVAFCYWNEDKPLMFVLQSSKETQRRIQYWQRQAWQLTITQLTPK